MVSVRIRVRNSFFKPFALTGFRSHRILFARAVTNFPDIEFNGIVTMVHRGRISA